MKVGFLEKAVKNKVIQIYDPEKDGEQTSIHNLKQFLNNPNQILVLKDYLFGGCEASNIIYLKTGSSSFNSSISLNLYCVLLGAHLFSLWQFDLLGQIILAGKARESFNHSNLKM